MALRVRTDEEVRVLKDEIGALAKTPTDELAHKLSVHYETADHLRAMMGAEIRNWEMEEIEKRAR